MATVKIDREGSGPVANGAEVTLSATVEGGSSTGWAWKHKGNVIPGATNSQYVFTMAADKAGAYTAVAKVNGTDVESSPEEITLGASEPAQGGSSTTELPPRFHPWFAGISALVLTGIAWFTLQDLLNGRAGFAPSDWTDLEGKLKIGASLAATITVVGGVALLAGLWMAVTEWRGRFAKDAETGVNRGVAEQIPGAIEAIGKLRGAGLAMVVGAILMLASAWIGQSAAGAPADSPSPSPSQSTPTPAPTTT